MARRIHGRMQDSRAAHSGEGDSRVAQCADPEAPETPRRNRSRVGVRSGDPNGNGRSDPKSVGKLRISRPAAASGVAPGVAVSTSASRICKLCKSATKCPSDLRLVWARASTACKPSPSERISRLNSESGTKSEAANISSSRRRELAVYLSRPGSLRSHRYRGSMPVLWAITRLDRQFLAAAGHSRKRSMVEVTSGWRAVEFG